jgi:hypothetical protein
VLLSATAWLARFTNQLVAFDHWLLWRYAGFVLATVVWLLSCVSIGHAVLRLLPDLGIRFTERLVFDFSVGVLLFAEGIFALGICGLLRPPFFQLYPLALLVIGACPLSVDLVHAWRTGAICRGVGLMYNAAFAFGTLGLCVVYLTIMVPENASFDARTYHLPIAEHYAAWGRIGKFPEGWFPGVLPHLASWLFTWPFMLREANLFDHVERAAHMEYALFVITVLSTPLLVEAICPGFRARGTWAVYFLFPGLFLYDSSLGLAADHVLAFWAVPVGLALFRVLERPSCPARATLAGLMMAGAAMTKYQSVYLLTPAALTVLFCTLHELWHWRRTDVATRPPFRAVVAAPGALAGAMLLATSSHWLPNLVWHGNPIYPLLHQLFPSHPLLADWRGLAIDAGWQPTGRPLAKLRETAAAMFTFAFVPHDWATFHRELPVFGFLFTLTLPVLLLVKGQWRARLLAGATLLGVFVWYWTYHQDRYLQSLLPWMVASTACALRLAWAAGAAARVGVCLLVGLQIAWGGDVPWLPTHAMTNDVPALRALGLLSSTFRGDFSSRQQFDTGFQELDRILPKDAVVLLHEEYLKLGLNRRSIADSARWQGAIDYRVLARPDRVDELLRSFGATHVVWGRSHSINREIPVSGELVFFGFVLRYGANRRDAGGFAVADLPTRTPPPREPGLTAYFGCHGAYAVPLEDVDRWVDSDGHGEGPGDRPDAILSSAEYAVVDGRCEQTAPSELATSFIQAPSWGDLTLWIREH